MNTEQDKHFQRALEYAKVRFDSGTVGLELQFSIANSLARIAAALEANAAPKPRTGKK